MRSGYIPYDIPVSEVIDEVGDQDLLDELSSRNMGLFIKAANMWDIQKIECFRENMDKFKLEEIEAFFKSR